MQVDSLPAKLSEQPKTLYLAVNIYLNIMGIKEKLKDIFLVYHKKNILNII